MTTPTVTLTIAEGPELQEDADRWQHYAYRVTLHYDGRRATFPWHQGIGIMDDPTAAAVLECLCADAAGYDTARGFEDWAGNYGYDTDSRKADAIYAAVGAQTRKLARLLGCASDPEPDWVNVDAETLALRLTDGGTA